MAHSQLNIVPLAERRTGATTVIGFIGLAMTLAKPLWVIPIIWSMADSALLTGVFIVVAMVWDHFDGVLFRQSRLANHDRLSRFRRVVDALGDRFLIHTVCVAAMLKTDFPLPAYLAILSRELLMLGIVAAVTVKAGRIIEPNWWSRGGILCIGLAILSWLGHQPVWCFAALGLMAALSAVGFWRYYQILHWPDR